MTQTEQITPKPSRIQQRNRKRILEAALDVFSAHGFRGATLDQIAEAAGLSKPNMLYYFAGKEEIHVTLLNGLMDTWLDPMRQINPKGEALEELLSYVRRKLEMSFQFPRESRLFANEVLQGAPRIGPHFDTGLKPLVEQTVNIIQDWVEAGDIAPVNPRHLIFSIWATTQHYADFEAQVQALSANKDIEAEAAEFLDTLYRRMLSVVQ